MLAQLAFLRGALVRLLARFTIIELPVANLSRSSCAVQTAFALAMQDVTDLFDFSAVQRAALPPRGGLLADLPRPNPTPRLPT